jgi:hypothetical protein
MENKYFGIDGLKLLDYLIIQGLKKIQRKWTYEYVIM